LICVLRGALGPPQRAHGALEDPIASNTLWKRQAAAFVLSMLKKRRRMALNAIAQRCHSVCTALLAFAQRAPRRSAFLNAVGTL